MNAVLGRIAATAQELAHYHSGDGNVFISIPCALTFTGHLKTLKVTSLFSSFLFSLFPIKTCEIFDPYFQIS